MRIRRFAIFLAALAGLVALAAAAGARPPAGPPLDSPGAGPAGQHRVVEQFVWINAGDHQIPATLAQPRGGGAKARFPAVLLIHGFASQKDEVGNFYKRLAEKLALEGYASLRFDFPGSGDSPLPFTANTIDFQVGDARTALDFLLSQPNVDPNRVGIVGFSLGGIVGATVAGTDPRVRALALWSTPGDTFAAFEALYDQYYAAAAANGSVVVDLGFRTVELSKAFFDSLAGSHPLDDVAGFRGPLLVVAGENDPPQPEYARQFVLHAGSYDATLRIIPGADHIYNVLTPDQTAAETVLLITATWFNEKL